LNERYRQRRTRLWYWRQAMSTVVASFFGQVWDHKALAIRALLTGWVIKVVWLSPFLYVYGLSARRLFSEGIEASLFLALLVIIAMMSTAWIIVQTHRSHSRPMVLLYLSLELIGSLLTFISKGAFGVYYWIFPLTQVIYAIESHSGVFNFVAALWASAAVTVISILIGGGFFTSDAQTDSAERQHATV